MRARPATARVAILSKSGNLAKWESPLTVAVVEGDERGKYAISPRRILTELADS